MRVKDMTPEERKLHNRNLRQARKAREEAAAARIYRSTGGGPVGMMIGSAKPAPSPADGATPTPLPDPARSRD